MIQRANPEKLGNISATNATDAVRDSWQRIQASLLEQLGEATFQSWIKPVVLIEADAHRVTLAVPTRFMREWIMSHYGEAIRDAWRKEMPKMLAFDLLVRPGIKPDDVLISQPPASDRAPAILEALQQATSGKRRSGAEEIAPLESTLDSRFTFDQFVVGKSNELAHAAALRVAEQPGAVDGCNPLFIYGGVGLGKTHLMHAIAWHIRHTHPERRVLYLSAEQFMYRFIRALRQKEAVAFKELFRSVDVLMIDDVQFICGKDSTQEEFFHTFNALIDHNKQIVLSGDRSPADLDGMEERIRSRLGWGLVADIHQSTFELRMSILQSKMEQLPHVNVPTDVLELLAGKVTSNIRELEGALNRIVAHATLVGRDISLGMVQEVLQDLLRASERRISISEIQKEVARHFNIRLSDMHSARRSRSVARPRQVAMYLAKKLTSKSLPEIGRKFGGKDHTTVMHAVKRIDSLMKEDSELADDVALLQRHLK